MKISIIGAGMVGAATAYRLATCPEVSHLVLYDIATQRADAEAQDIAQAAVFEHGAKVINGDLTDTKESDIVIITAGAPQNPGQSRLDLASKNAGILQSFAKEVYTNSPNAYFVMASNPVDVMAHAFLQYSGANAAQVMGTGTILDTMRFRYYLKQAGLQDKQALNKAFVVGEHGDSQVAVFQNLPQIFIDRLSLQEKENIAYKTKHAAYDIIEGKGATYYGIASGISRLVQALAGSITETFSVSVYDAQYNAFYGYPHAISCAGIGEKLEIAMSKNEKDSLLQSIYLIKTHSQEIGI